MKIYIVSVGYDHEGLGEPEKAFTSRELALEYVGGDYPYGDYVITELTLEGIDSNQETS